jgi:hypothetical protein
VTNLIVANIVTPIYAKHAMKVSFFQITLSRLGWTFLLGLPEAILAIPLRVAFKEFIANNLWNTQVATLRHGCSHLSRFQFHYLIGKRRNPNNIRITRWLIGTSGRAPVRTRFRRQTVRAAPEDCCLEAITLGLSGHLQSGHRRSPKIRPTETYTRQWSNPPLRQRLRQKAAESDLSRTH